jgi:hypothetical protein
LVAGKTVAKGGPEAEPEAGTEAESTLSMSKQAFKSLDARAWPADWKSVKARKYIKI